MATGGGLVGQGGCVEGSRGLAGWLAAGGWMVGWLGGAVMAWWGAARGWGGPGGAPLGWPSELDRSGYHSLTSDNPSPNCNVRVTPTALLFLSHPQLANTPPPTVTPSTPTPPYSSCHTLHPQTAPPPPPPCPGLLIGAAACLGCAMAPPGPAQMILAAVGKFGCAGAFTIASIFTSELFPTLVRSKVLGAENQVRVCVWGGSSLHLCAARFWGQ